MTDEAQLSSLLLDWQERHDRGENVSAAELCRDCPELTVELQKRIAAVQHMDRLTTFAHSAETTDDSASRQTRTFPRDGTHPRHPSPAGYEILGEIGHGGMGVVYKARDVQLDRVVALKQVRTAAPHPSAEALADDLRRSLDGGPLSETTTLELVRRRPGKNGLVRWLIAAAVVLTLLALGLVAWQPWKSASTQSSSSLAFLEPAAWKGWIDLRVANPKDANPKLRWLYEPLARPLRAGCEVRIEGELNREAYAYVLWIDSDGKVLPVYPWKDGEWKQRPAQERPIRKLSLPENPGDVFPISPGAAGMETLILFACATPLDASVDVAALAGELGSQHWSDADAVAWFENYQEVKDDHDRAANLKQVKGSSNPVLRTQGLLQERLGLHFDYSRAVSFGNQGN